MKRITFIIMLAICSMCANAQRIVYDKVEDGVRTIATDFFRMWTRGLTDIKMNNLSQGVDAKLLACIDDTRVVYMLCVNMEYSGLFTKERVIPTNGKCLIRLKDDSIIDLTSLTSAETRYQFTNVTVTTIQDNKMITEGKTYVNNSKEIMGIYPISEEDLQRLNIGVAKVRVELLPKSFDYEYKKKEKFSPRITQAYELIKARLLDQDKNSIYDGF